jgi:phosphoribosylanthranilate isomerase
MLANYLIKIFFIIFTFTTHAADISMCGPKPSKLSSFFTDAEKIRIKCIENAYELEKKLRDEEVRQLDLIQKQLETDLKKVAYKVSYAIVQCHSPKNDWPIKKTEECQKINQQRNAIISRIDHLMGWDEPFKNKIQKNVQTELANNLELPCPNDEELQKIQSVRYFNRKAFKTWERCVNLRY